MSDLRAAATVFKGRKVAPGVRALIVPGSQRIKKAAEAEGLDKVFTEAGAEWREAGCSMCIAMNGDQLEPGQYSVSTSNRNFEGRQGKGGRTFLASPLTAVASGGWLRRRALRQRCVRRPWVMSNAGAAGCPWFMSAPAVRRASFCDAVRTVQRSRLIGTITCEAARESAATSLSSR